MADIFEEIKMIGVCWLGHNGDIRHATFTEESFRQWLKERGVEIKEKYFVDAQMGETYSYIERYNFIFWRMIPFQQEKQD